MGQCAIISIVYLTLMNVSVIQEHFEQVQSRVDDLIKHAKVSFVLIDTLPLTYKSVPHICMPNPPTHIVPNLCVEEESWN